MLKNRPFSNKNEMLQLRQVIIPFEFKCMNASNIVAALHEFSKT